MKNKILAKRLKEVMEQYQKMGYFTFTINELVVESAVYYSIAEALFKDMTVKDFIQFFNLED
jgi:hypothetical protein